MFAWQQLKIATEERCFLCGLAKMLQARQLTAERHSQVHLTLNGWDIPFVEHVKYLGVIFDEMFTWRIHIKMTGAKAIRTFIRIHYLLKSEHLSTNIKLTLHKALIRSEVTYACPPGNYSAYKRFSYHTTKLCR
jgi:hypothetical protein